MNKRRFIAQTLCILSLLAYLLLGTDLILDSSDPSTTYNDINPPITLPIVNTHPPSLDDLLKNPTTALVQYDSLWFYHDGYASATIPLMIAQLLIPHGPILELGLNKVTTKLLTKISHDYNRSVHSVELIKKKFDFDYKALVNKSGIHHRIELVDYRELVTYGAADEWALVFVDHSVLAMRAKTAMDMHRNARMVLVHDAEKRNENVHMLAKNYVESYFKYRCKYTVFEAKDRGRHFSTLMLSNHESMNGMRRVLESFRPVNYERVVCGDEF